MEGNALRLFFLKVRGWVPWNVFRKEFPGSLLHARDLLLPAKS
jgi:hypothetical protein